MCCQTTCQQALCRPKRSTTMQKMLISTPPLFSNSLNFSHMKKWILAGLLPFLSAALLLHACYPESPSTYEPNIIDYTVLPPITQTGANTFGCKVNGEVWVPRVPIGAVTYRPIDVLVWEKNGTGKGLISCNLVDLELKIDNWLSIVFTPTFFESGEYCNGEVEVTTGAQFRATSGKRYDSDLHVSSNNCVTIALLDTVNNIISGTFEFSVYNDSINLNDKIEITEGRFDLKYSPQ